MPVTPAPTLLDHLLSGVSENVVNGWETVPNAFPYHVHLSYNSDSGLRCGGAILNTFYILTAAHCLVGKKLGDLKVVAGDHNRRLFEGPEQVRQIEFAVLNEYNDITFDNDIAVVKLKEELVFNKNVSSLPFPRRRMKFKGVGVKTGWGQTNESPFSLTHSLRYVVLPLLSRLHCIRVFNGTDVRITDRLICAGFPSRGTCQGDSGGPLVCRLKETARPILCGITSHSLECEKGEYPGMNTDVSYYGQWIQDVLDEKIEPNMFPEKNRSSSAVVSSVRREEKCSTPAHYACTLGNNYTLCLIRKEICGGEDDCSELEEKCNVSRATANITTSRTTTTTTPGTTTTLKTTSTTTTPGTTTPGPTTSPRTASTTTIPRSTTTTSGTITTTHGSTTTAPGTTNTAPGSTTTTSLTTTTTSGATSTTTKPGTPTTKPETTPSTITNFTTPTPVPTNTGLLEDVVFCSNGTSIRLRMNCTETEDCNDLTENDLANCPPSNETFKCQLDGQEISPSAICDGIRHCPDWSDEISCRESNHTLFLCSSGTYIWDVNKCNRFGDCEDHSDEAKCTDFSIFHRCDNGNITMSRHQCDGDNDCGDRSDEAGCLYECRNGNSTNKRNKCNGANDCGDWSDEFDPESGLNCTDTLGNPTTFECADGTRILFMRSCNRAPDCPDGSDEANCTVYRNFRCPGGKLVLEKDRCNEVNDCGDWSDEWGCLRSDGNFTTFNCTNGNTIGFWKKCDGVNDCGDWLDELGCLRSDGNFTTFNCTNRKTIGFRNKCDGYNTCGDWSDEWGCLNTDGTPTVYNCSGTGATLGFRSKCNYLNDCGDWTDEVGCRRWDGNLTVFHCSNGNLTGFWSRCDGLNSCGDWSDEFGCRRWDGNLTVFHCSNGNLTGFWSRCDGLNSCGDWSDEFGCRRWDGNLTVFFCANKRIVSFFKKCNQMDDCGDNSDELNCPQNSKTFELRGRLKKCGRYEFTCVQAKTSARRCIPYVQRCDRRYQCPRGEDEVGCQEGNVTRENCGPGRISCVMRPPFKGTCPPKLFLCDGTEQCFNGKDEQNCSISGMDIVAMTTTTPIPLSISTVMSKHRNAHLPCLKEEYRCQYEENLCIPLHFLCDGDVDCDGGDDEVSYSCGLRTTPKYGPMERGNCSEEDYSCPSWGNCIPKNWLCDGSPDCPDKEDESNCTTTTIATTTPFLLPTMSLRKFHKSRNCGPTEFSCLSGGNQAPCIPSRYVCDGDLDCLGGEDEKNCIQIEEPPSTISPYDNTILNSSNY